MCSREAKDKYLYIFKYRDKGKEFIARLQEFLKKSDIRFQVTRNPDIKAAVVEHFYRMLEEQMWRYFTHKNTRYYIDVAGYHACLQSYPSFVYQKQPVIVTRKRTPRENSSSME